MNRLYFIFCFFLLMSLERPIYAQTILQPGDLAVLGLASNVGGDLGDCTPAGNSQFQGRDRVSFVCFQDISPGTQIDITDNGWERETTGLWGNTEGFIRATRTGAIIPAGTVITFEFPPTKVDAESISPDGDWAFSALGTNALNFNDSGDQIYFLQGGEWNNGTVLGCCNGEQDASYTGGRILFAFNSKSAWNGLSGDSQNSALHPDIIPCFNMTPTSEFASFTSYSGPLAEAPQLEWIARISDSDNWAIYENCNAYQDPVSNIVIAPGDMSIDCTVCQSCSAFQDTLIFNLPDSGGPFSILYSNGQDTFSLAGASDGMELPITVDASISYTLISVTDANSCPVYSNFESGVNLIVQELDQLEIALEIMTSFACGSGWDIQINDIAGGVAPYSVRLNEAGPALPIDELPLALSDLEPGTYHLIFEDQDGCRTVSNIDVPNGSNENNLILDYGPDRQVQRGQSVRVEPNINFNPITVIWSPETAVEDPNSVFTLIRPDRTTLYTATATDTNGCTVMDSILITVLNKERAFIPSAFSPNNDGVNDSFLIFPGPEISEVRSFRIFDRWGNKVYEAMGNLSQEQTAWDGRLLNGQNATSGVYLYFTELQHQDGEVEMVRGSVTLIR